MFAVQADEKLKSEATDTGVRSTTFLCRFEHPLVKMYSAQGWLVRFKMADGGEEVLVENDKTEDEVELDLAKCASEFAKYCQVDVRNEVCYPSIVYFAKYFERTFSLV